MLYVRRNELDKEKQYIEHNISFTKNAYNINIEEIEVTSSGTITNKDIQDNKEVIDNIKLIKEDTMLTTLKEYQTSLGYYAFDNTKLGVYNIDGKDSLVYITPREIIGNNTSSYSNKTYQYTHGYGVILNSATNTSELGISEYIQKDFDMKDSKVNVVEPRIYFGLKTDESIITNAKDTVEYDYPLSRK